jgi:uncharacterized protein involved in response to NO
MIMKIPLNNLTTEACNHGPALWQLGFRPCFLLANVYALMVMVLWLLIQQGVQFPGLNYYGANYWHAHEMIFAYSMLVIAGFLLTAIKNWTGIQTVQGGKLQLLVGSWLVARLLIFMPHLPSPVVAMFDMCFPVLLIWFVAQPLIASGNKRNYMMIAIVGVFALLNGLFHYGLSNESFLMVSRVLLMGLILILLLVTVMSGRVFAMFSQNGVTQRYQAKIYPSLEKSLPITMLALAIVWVFFSQQKWLLLVISMVNFVLHGWRLFGWYNSQIWQKPLVWVLHVGYAFLVIGFAFVAASAFLPWLQFVALHVFTVGGIGMITMGMMARVSFGHTGRDLHQPPAVLWYCFNLLALSALVRITLPLVDVFHYSSIILLSGLLWILAFGLFVLQYLPIWLRPRVDGKPG